MLNLFLILLWTFSYAAKKPCKSDADCDETSFCGGGQCVLYRTEGQSCGGFLAPLNVCLPGLFCKSVSPSPGPHPLGVCLRDPTHKCPLNCNYWFNGCENSKCKNGLPMPAPNCGIQQKMAHCKSLGKPSCPYGYKICRSDKDCEPAGLKSADLVCTGITGLAVMSQGCRSSGCGLDAFCQPTICLADCRQGYGICKPRKLVCRSVKCDKYPKDGPLFSVCCKKNPIIPIKEELCKDVVCPMVVPQCPDGQLPRPSPCCLKCPPPLPLPKKCTPPKKFNKCGSPCTRTCAKPNPVCILPCEPKCECPPDRPIEHNGKCIALKECPKITVKPFKPTKFPTKKPSLKPCNSNKDCDSKSFCRFRDPQGNAKVCAPYSTEGGSCGGFVIRNFVKRCLPGLFCVDLAPKIADEPGWCLPRPKDQCPNNCLDWNDGCNDAKCIDGVSTPITERRCLFPGIPKCRKLGPPSCPYKYRLCRSNKDCAGAGNKEADLICTDITKDCRSGHCSLDGFCQSRLCTQDCRRGYGICRPRKQVCRDTVCSLAIPKCPDGQRPRPSPCCLKCPPPKPKVCPPSMIYSKCGPACTPTCANPNPICPQVCVDGCHCPLDRPILHKGFCFPENFCHKKQCKDVDCVHPQNNKLLSLLCCPKIPLIPKKCPYEYKLCKKNQDCDDVGDKKGSFVCYGIRKWCRSSYCDFNGKCRVALCKRDCKKGYGICRPKTFNPSILIPPIKLCIIPGKHCSLCQGPARICPNDKSLKWFCTGNCFRNPFTRKCSSIMPRYTCYRKCKHFPLCFETAIMKYRKCDDLECGKLCIRACHFKVMLSLNKCLASSCNHKY